MHRFVVGLLLLGTIVLGPPNEVRAADVSIFSDGFESGNLAAWTSSSGMIAQQGLVFTGSWAGRATTSATAGYASATLVPPRTDVTLSAHVEVISAGSRLTLLRVRTGTGTGIVSLKVNKAGKLLVRNQVAAMEVVSTTILGFNAWHDVTLHVVVAGGSSTVDVSLDGSPVMALSKTMSLGTNPIARVQIGATKAVTGDVAFDDVYATANVPPRIDPIVTAAGDICGVKPVSCQGTANLVVALDPDLALTLGDNQYNSGTLAQYSASYDTTWGAFKTRTRPAPGNHEWKTADAQGYRDYFGSTVQTNGGLWYSFDIGGWHVVSLDSDCTFVGGCSIGSPEYAWLQQDLANDQHACTLAYWHHPLFSSGAEHGGTTTVSPFWDLLIADSAEVVLNGHSHDYERFSPQTTAGAMSSLGIREFVVGTGGVAGTFGAIQPNSEVRISGEKGVLELTLAGDGYSWRFVAVSGTVLDQGTDSCH